jgi:arylsulfatase A-like enzyme
VRCVRDLYRATIRETDRLVRQLVEKLDRQGLADETVLVIFGDHGDHYGANGWYGHQFSVEDEVIRIPLLIRDPTGALDDGQKQVVQLNDVYPTLLEILGFEYPETSNVDLTTEPRETAYVYYSAPDSLIKRLTQETGISREELPPARQYVAWRSPDERLIYSSV